MTTRLLVARHGAAEYETDTVTDAGGSLTAEGRAQSRALGEQLASYGVTAVYCSSMARATQTAELAARALDVDDVRVRDGLREFSVGDLEGAPCEPDPIQPIYAQWVAGDLDVRIPGAESGREGIARRAAVLDDVADRHPGETVLVVSHGAAICATLPTLARNLSIEMVHGRHLAHCVPVELERDERGWVVRGWPGLDVPLS